MGNLDNWNRFADIDPQFTKPITGKPYKGTSPNPQYVIRCLTEMFGPVGQGFGWNVVREEFTPLGGETLHWCRIEFWHTSRENTFDSYGQTKAAYVTKSGHQIVDEDAPKKSLTDAIIKAASQIGVGANIFLGRWDDQKYVEQVDAEYRQSEKPAFDPAAARDRIKGKLEKAPTLEVLGENWKSEQSVIAEIKAVSEPMYLEIVKAKDDRKSALGAQLTNQGAG